MAANFWASTQQRCWLFEKDRLAEARKTLEDRDKQLILQFPLPDLRLFSIYINQQLIKLGKRMSTRQQPLATAQVYIRRFYTKVEIRRTNPYLVLATAFYLACKMEECPHHIRYIVAEARGLWPDFIISDVSKFGEMEFWLISELNSQLIVHHPYRALSELQSTLGLSNEESSLAWSIINDHFLTDLPLLQPPHVIAVMAILIAVVFKPSPPAAAQGPGPGSQGQMPSGGSGGPPSHAASFRDGVTGALSALAGDKAAAGPGATGGGGGSGGGGGLPPRISRIVDWLAEGEVNIEAVIECTQELLSLYEIWGVYSEKTCKEQIGRYVKARSLDK